MPHYKYRLVVGEHQLLNTMSGIVFGDFPEWRPALCKVLTRVKCSLPSSYMIVYILGKFGVYWNYAKKFYVYMYKRESRLII